MKPLLARPTREDVFMAMAILASSRGTCIRRRCGAVIVRGGHLLTTGYNGAPAGVQHCGERGCIRAQHNVLSGTRHELCWGVHAEENAILQAAKLGICLSGSMMFSTNNPCSMCAKSIANVGISKVYYIETYPDELAAVILKEAYVELIRMDVPVFDRFFPVL